MLNTVILMGRFAHSPELKATPNGTPVVKFSLAVARSIKLPNGEREVDWIDCVAWRNTAEFIEKHFKKGDPIIVEGRIETRNYEDKQGNKRKAFEVIVNNVNFAGSANKKDDNVSNNEEISDSLADNDLLFSADDDLPF